MKSEERHRLAENELVKGLNQIVTGAKRPPNLILFMVVLLVVVVGIYWYWSSTAANRLARSWMDFYQRRGSIEDAPASLKSGPAGQVVQLTQADAAFERGFNRLFSDPQSALKEFESAAKQYEELSKSANNADIQLRAMIGAGKSYESTGDVKNALAMYDAVLTKFANNKEWLEHPLVLEAKEYKAKLSTGESGLTLYQSWADKLKQVSSSTDLKPPLPLTIPTPPEPEKK